MHGPVYNVGQINQVVNLLPWRRAFTEQRSRRVKQCAMALILTWLISAYWVGCMHQERLRQFAQAQTQLTGYQTDRAKQLVHLYTWHERQTALLQGLYASQEQQWLARTLITMADMAIRVEGKIQALSITRALDKKGITVTDADTTKPHPQTVLSKGAIPLATDTHGRFVVTTSLPWAQIDHQLKLDKPWVLHSARQPDAKHPYWRLEIIAPAKQSF